MLYFKVNLRKELTALSRGKKTNLAAREIARWALHTLDEGGALPSSKDRARGKGDFARFARRLMALEDPRLG